LAFPEAVGIGIKDDIPLITFKRADF